jgi:hypothetical protein
MLTIISLTDFQRGLIEVLYHNNRQAAYETFVQNLHCPFSNTQSMNMLNQLWDIEMKSQPNNHALLASHADIVSSAIRSLALKKYNEAVIMAMEQQHYNDAVLYSIKAEKTIPYLLNSSVNTGNHNTISLYEWNRIRLDAAKSHRVNTTSDDGTFTGMIKRFKKPLQIVMLT